jgi:hypothetical protein
MILFTKNGATVELKALFFKKATEIILGALLLTAISVFSHALREQGKTEDRLWECEQTVAQNCERLNSIDQQFIMREKFLEARFTSMEAMLELILKSVSKNQNEEDLENGLSNMYE